MISQRSVETVLETVRIEDVVREYVDLKTRGSNLIGLCPFHKEKTPSFSVSPSKNIFKCFGCSKGGNAVHFLMEVEQLNFPEAIRQLAKKYKIELEESDQDVSQQETNEIKESLFVINKFAQDYYKNLLWHNSIGQSVGLNYFKQRGFLESTILKFELGFAPDEQDALTQEALKKGFKTEYLAKSGLSTNQQKDFFRNRVIFPIHNVTGKPIAFAGRSLSSNPKSPKYINSPETELYNKSKSLYGLHLAKRMIRQKNSVILVEGYTDVISLHQAGIENVVSSSGTSLTEDQVQLIKRITTQVTILYDGDPAGIKAASRGMDLIIQEGIDIKIALIPDQEDPDSFIKKIGADAFERFLTNEATDFILFKLNLHSKAVDNNPIEKSIAAKDILQTIAKVEDPIKRALYLKQTANTLKLDEIQVIESCNRFIKEERQNRMIQEKRQSLERDQQILKDLKEDAVASSSSQYMVSIFSDEFQEKDVCRVLMLWGQQWFDQEHNISYAHYILENISDTIPFFENDLIKKVVLDVSEQLSSGRIPDVSYYIAHPDPKISELALELTMTRHEYSPNWSNRWNIFLSTQNIPEENFKSDITNSLLRFKLKKYNKAIQEFENKIKEAKLNELELEIELKSHQHIVNERNYIASLLKTVVI